MNTKQSGTFDNKTALQQTLLYLYDHGMYKAKSTQAVKQELAIELALRNGCKGVIANSHGGGDYASGGPKE